ncbi:hypothetical protein DFH07DRAFT_145528 [Mycena maculata]|uniref:Uncharacterized protein n=1 Tax=Mycena maculata TaxID=230809 RepID=A0AAD7NRZ9_9AGAR|nr:hypothetical protein DFH07DRAFT_145528 [Mycena maculata]
MVECGLQGRARCNASSALESQPRPGPRIFLESSGLDRGLFSSAHSAFPKGDAAARVFPLFLYIKQRWALDAPLAIDMTRSASPAGVEFSYDFPVASTSTLAPPSSYSSHASSRLRSRTPVRPLWEDATPDADDDDDDEEPDYASYGYPTATRRRGATVPIPTATGNQWRAPSPPYPYSSTALSVSVSGLGYPQYPYPNPSDTPSSYDSTRTCASAASHRKITKPRRLSTDSAPASPLASPPRPSPLSSSSPHSSPECAPASLDEDEEPRGRAPHASRFKPHLDLRRQWAALSLRVRFGVFRAKRRLRGRVMSL